MILTIIIGLISFILGAVACGAAIIYALWTCTHAEFVHFVRAFEGDRFKRKLKKAKKKLL